MPGVGSVLQLCPGSSASMSIVIIPVAVLVDKGLTILSDLPSFAGTEAGSKLIEKTGWVVTLFKSEMLLWIPYGFYPIPLAREPDDEKQECTASLWVKPLWSVQLAQSVPQPVWLPLYNVNKEHMQSLSGKRLWKQRLDTFEKIGRERSAKLLGFADSQTIPCDELPVVDDNEKAAEKAKTKAESSASAKVKATPKATATVTSSAAGPTAS